MSFAYTALAPNIYLSFVTKLQSNNNDEDAACWTRTVDMRKLNPASKPWCTRVGDPTVADDVSEVI